MNSGNSLPNILFLFTDQQRPDWFEMNPDVPVRTPNLRALVERGAQFTNAVCPSPVCAPSRSCLASGLEYDRCRVWSNDTDFPEEHSPYHQRLRDEAGYHVMGCGKYHVGNNQRGNPPEFDWGVDGKRLTQECGFSDALFNAGMNQCTILMRRTGEPQDAYMAFLADRGLADDHIRDYQRRSQEGVWTATFPTSLPDDAYYDNWITENGLELLERAPSDRPWYMEVNFQNPHHPWDITENMHAGYRDPDVEFPVPEFCELDVTPETHQEVRRNYAAMVEHLDDCVGRFVDRLETRGELENTIVVFSSDHGEMLGDYNQWQKLSPLQASVGVPLFVAGPNVRHIGECGKPHTILDLHATFLDYAGLTPSAELDSRSMKSFLAGETDQHRDVVLSGLSGWRMAFDGRFKLIRGYDPAKRVGGDQWDPMHVPTEEAGKMQRERPQILYDIQTNEKENVAAQCPEAAERLESFLDT
ncbi:MAG: sulfatase-like hydrolase/transferase [Planctomycetota bacterium]|jgi:choline-sulfatase|nr:sulfatase-like hydrolase/transferase [Planctomycetota bacterium]